MNNTQQQFLSLICSGLWNKPINTDSFIEYADWDAIIEISNKQTVLGILFDGITKLPAEMQPPAILLRKLYQNVIRIEQSNLLMNKCLAEVVSAMNKENIHSVLLKGQGVARNYPNSVRRQCGDIDLYVGKENGGKAIDVLLGMGARTEYKEKKIRERHEVFYINEICLELHFIVDELRNPFYNPKFQKWTKRHIWGDNLRVWNLNNEKIQLPPVDFDVLYIFDHIFHHFTTVSIGLRHLSDWVVYLHTFKDQINREDLFQNLNTFGLFKAWQVFGYIAVNNLDLPKEELPFYTEKYKTHSQKVLNIIMETGNFGMMYSNDKRPKVFLSGIIHHLKFKFLWLSKILPIFPKDVFLFLIHHLIKSVSGIFKSK